MGREQHIPKPAGGRAFMVSAGTLAKINALLDRFDVEMDSGQFEMIEVNGKRHYRLRPQASFPEPGGGGGAGDSGAFYGLFKEDGHTYLQGGTVTGGSGTETIGNIKVIDKDTGPVEADGRHLYIEATGNGVVEEGVVLPGWDLTSASTSTGASVPGNTLPLAEGGGGKKCHVSLGVFTGSGFLPAGKGNVSISFCPGGYNVRRENNGGED